jgi:phosphoglycolate phosphatase
VLDALAARYQLAVLSNKPHALTVEVMAQACARWPFAVIHGQHPGRPYKPDPAALLGVARGLGLEVTQCVLVGDSEVDIATARAAGTTSIAVSWGLRPLPVLVAAHPDHLVHTPAELAALFA